MTPELFGFADTVVPELSVWAQWGLAGIVIAYTMWADRSREERMSNERKEHDTWVRATLLDALERNTRALEKLTALAKERTVLS